MKRNNWKESNNLRIHDPKLVPLDGERVTLEFSEEEYRQLEQVKSEEGCWSIEEFVRSGTAEIAAACRK